MDALHPPWLNTSEHQFVWGDDAYMGSTLPSRMVLAGLDTPVRCGKRIIFGAIHVPYV
jgi:hypothetical protein